LFLELGFSNGHAHVPFSGFPEYLIMAPIIPVYTVGLLVFDTYNQENIEYLLSFFIITVIFISLKNILQLIYNKYKIRFSK